MSNVRKKAEASIVLTPILSRLSKKALKKLKFYQKKGKKSAEASNTKNGQ